MWFSHKTYNRFLLLRSDRLGTSGEAALAFRERRLVAGAGGEVEARGQGFVDAENQRGGLQHLQVVQVCRFCGVQVKLLTHSLLYDPRVGQAERSNTLT